MYWTQNFQKAISHAPRNRLFSFTRQSVLHTMCSLDSTHTKYCCVMVTVFAAPCFPILMRLAALFSNHLVILHTHTQYTMYFFCVTHYWIHTTLCTPHKISERGLVVLHITACSHLPVLHTMYSLNSTRTMYCCVMDADFAEPFFMYVIVFSSDVAGASCAPMHIM